MFPKSFVAAVLAYAPMAAAVANPQIARQVSSASAAISISSIMSEYSHAVYQSFAASRSAIPPATTTGALSTTVTGTAIPLLPPGPDATSYPRDGLLHGAEPAPYTPSGGLDTNGSEPVYVVQSDFDYESIALALYQEWIELDLFHHGLAMFSDEEFENAGLDAEDRFLIEFMADQEVGHAQLLTNILGPRAPVQCEYQYPFTTVREFVDFCQKLTRFGESGVYGFLKHLNSGPAAQLLLQSITTEARQQMIFRQFEGLFPMPVWFETGVPQSWAWTLLAPYISSCSANQTRLIWQNFPALTIENNPNPYRLNPNMTRLNETISNITVAEECGILCDPAITHNHTALSYPGRQVYLSWENPGRPIGPNNSYITNTTAGAPAYVMWVSQLNATVTALTNISGNTGMTIQPNMSTYAGDPAVNGTMFIALLDRNITATPYNLSYVNPYVRAGPALYLSG